MDMYGKILITCSLVVRTGLHIGGSGVFSPIGAVDSPVIRDPMTRRPIVPGSSLKGKLRTLLVRNDSHSKGNGLDGLPKVDEDSMDILRLFGSAQPVRRSRLQFADCFVTNAEKMSAVGLTEVKIENSIDRATSVANPRQIERVNPGVEFGVRIVYDVVAQEEMEADLTLLAKGMKLLQLDYLGGHGSRGSGRVSFRDFHVKNCEDDQDQENSSLTSLFKAVEDYELLPV